MKVVFATDGSSHADHAITEALRLLGRGPTKAWVVGVAERVPTLIALESLASGVGVLAEQDRLGNLVAIGQAQALLAARGVEAEAVQRVGDPADEIVALAEAHGADLIVLGSRGRNALGRFMLGSVSEGVLHRWPGATMVIQAPGEP